MSNVVNAISTAQREPLSPERTLLLIGHQTDTVRKAKALGLGVILIQHRDKFEAVQAELADVTLIADFTDWSVVAPLAEAARQIWGYAAAVSLTEPGLEIAGRINDRYGLGGTGYEPARLLRDKWAMRQHLVAVGAPTVAARLLDDRAGLSAFGAEHGYPFVVKPTDLTAGFGILKVTGPDDEDRVWEQVSRLRAVGMDRGSTLYQVQDFLLEEYITGPEFSIEALSFEGRHIVVGITEKSVDPDHFAELGHAMPARVEPGVEARIVAEVGRFLDAIGIRNGPSHTELRISPRGPLVIESHNRVGGGHIGELVEAAYGIDLISYTLGWPFRLVEELTERPEPIGGACARALLAPPGRVEGIEGIEELRAHPAVLAVDLAAHDGAIVRPMQDNWDRLGLVAVTAEDTDAAVKLCEDLVATAVAFHMAPSGEV